MCVCVVVLLLDVVVAVVVLLLLLLFLVVGFRVVTEHCSVVVVAVGDSLHTQKESNKTLCLCLA